MAPDQRYCIDCGERRTGGGLRDSLPRTEALPVAAPAPRRARLTPNTSFIAGVATLLLAMGVGVLIGRSGHDAGPASAATPQVVTVAAGTAGAATTADSAATTSAASSKSSSKKSKKSKSSAAKVSGASSVDATAKKNGVKLPPKVVKIGQACGKGVKGCEGGKFTGNFFGN